MKMKTQECIISVVGAAAITYAISYLYAYIAPANFVQSISALQFISPQSVMVDLSIRAYLMAVISLSVYILIFVHAYKYIYDMKK